MREAEKEIRVDIGNSIHTCSFLDLFVPFSLLYVLFFGVVRLCCTFLYLEDGEGLCG